MNIFRRVALQSMRRNRTRTIVTIIGVLLSTAMFTAVTTFGATLLFHLREVAAHNSGTYYVNLNALSADTLAELREDEVVSSLTAAEVLGYAPVDSKNENKPFLYIQGIEENYSTLCPVHLLSGRLPETDSELLIPEHLRMNGHVLWEIGDTVTLTLGERSSTGYRLWQHTAYYPAEPEEFIERETLEYTIVGIYERPDHEELSAPGFMALTAASGDSPTGLYDVYAQTTDYSNEMLYNLLDRYDHEGGGSLNWDYLMTLGNFKYSNYGTLIVNFAIIFILLILIGSVSMIYSAFSISVSERTKQFGLLSSIGATRKQLRRTVFYEAGTVILTGVPLGLLAGCGGMGTTFALLGNRLSSLFGDGLPLRYHVSPFSLAAAAGIAAVTVLISAIVPAKRATRISAIEAIRQTRDVTPIRRGTSGRLAYRLFGLPGMLSQKYFRHSRKKYRATIFSLAMSVLLFVSAGTYVMYLTESLDVSSTVGNYDLSYGSSDVTMEDYARLLPSLRQADGIKRVFAATSGTCSPMLAPEQYDAQYANAVAGGFLDPEAATEGLLTGMPLSIECVDDDTFNELLAQCGLTRADYEAHPGALLYNHINYETTHIVDREKGEFVRVVYDGAFFSPGLDTLPILRAEEIEDCAYSELRYADGAYVLECYSESSDRIWDVPAEAVSLPILACIDEALTSPGQPTLYLPASASSAYSTYLDLPTHIYCTVKNTEKALTSVTRILQEDGIAMERDHIFDAKAYDREQRNILTVVQVFSYGFISLISLICVANVFNTISTNVGLRRRDFAMLRSVGLTRGGLNRMVCFECLLYGARALAFGLPLSLPVTLWLYRSVGAVYYNTRFQPSWPSVFIASGSVFLVVFISMMYAMRKVKRDNPVDALKEENT